MDFTRDGIVDYVRGAMGWPIVEAEIEDSQLDDSIDDALLLFNRYIGEIQLRAYYEQVDSVVIQLEEGARGVSMVKCVFPESTRVYAQLNVFELMYRLVYPQLPIGEWYMLRSFYEQYQRIRGSEPEWYYDEFSRKLYVECSGGPWDVWYSLSNEPMFKEISR